MRRHAATVVLAIGVPAAAAAWVGHRTDELAAHLGRAGGVPAHIGSLDADLTGTIRLSDVALGDLFAADAIEASVALESLLAGQLGADEIRVAAPRVSIEVDRDGDSDLARLIRRLAHAGAHGTGPARLRRIVVGSGTLAAHVAGLGELTADDVELVPDAGGVRVITGRLHIHGGEGRVHGELELVRSAAELALPRVRFGRVLAVAGAGTMTIGDRTATLRDVAIGRLSPDGVLEAHATLDGHEVGAEVAAGTVVLHGDRVPLRAFAALVPHGILLDDARASGRLEVRRDGAALQLAADGSFDGVAFDHRAIAEQPVAIGATVRGAVTVSADAVAVDQLAIGVGAAQWTASGWLRRGTPASGQLDLRLASAPCGELLASLPAEIRAPLDGMAMTGAFGGRARLAIDLAAPVGDGAELGVELDNGCTVTVEPPASDVTALAGPSEQAFADGSHAKVGKGAAGWAELRHLPGHVSGAFTSAEDARFFEHHGFDVRQIARSFEIDLRDRRLSRGGSTISQQLVKNAFLTQRRTLDRKIQEAILTWRLESRLDKKTILERYLNVIELGPHVFGIGAAAQHWFGVPARELSVHQAAFLAALTSEPQSMSRRVRHAGGLDAESSLRVDVILRAMRRDGVIDKDQLDAAREAPLHFAASALRREL